MVVDFIADKLSMDIVCLVIIADDVVLIVKEIVAGIYYTLLNKKQKIIKKHSNVGKEKVCVVNGARIYVKTVLRNLGITELKISIWVFLDTVYLIVVGEEIKQSVIRNRVLVAYVNSLKHAASNDYG